MARDVISRESVDRRIPEFIRLGLTPDIETIQDFISKRWGPGLARARKAASAGDMGHSSACLQEWFVEGLERRGVAVNKR